MEESFHLKINGLEFSYCYPEVKVDKFNLHCHSTYEIYYFEEGDADYMVEGNQYHLTPKSVLLLAPNVFHGVRLNSNAPYKRFVMNISPAFISLERRNLLFSIFPEARNFELNKPYKEVYYENTEEFNLDSFFENIQKCFSQSSNAEQLLPIYVESLLSELNLMCQKLSPIPYHDTISQKLSEVISYLNEHLSEQISLDSLAERFFINKHYLNRIFRKATSTTVMDYLRYKRVIYAKQLLEKGRTAEEVSLECGFSDYTTFYRAYCKVLQHSPRVDQKRF